MNGLLSMLDSASFPMRKRKTKRKRKRKKPLSFPDIAHMDGQCHNILNSLSVLASPMLAVSYSHTKHVIAIQ
jgi:hypothetical protein